MVEFRLDHVVYTDQLSPDLWTMRSALLTQLEAGHMGDYNATTDNFVFELEGNGKSLSWFAVDMVYEYNH